MSSEEVIKIINEIGSRIGATTYDLYPKLVKYGIMSNSLGFIITFLCFVVSVLIVKKYCKEAIEEEETFSILVTAIGVAAFLVSFIFWVYALYCLLLWIFCPEMQAIDYILKCI